MKQNANHSEPNDPTAESIERLCDELSAVYSVLDEIRTELQWANRNRDDGPWRPDPVHITSMPLDPTAPDWAERVNRYSAADLADDDPACPSSSQGFLF